ncbi:Fc.00g036810.m01.CDS01 [Cosmosporella sp. VM-42]
MTPPNLQQRMLEVLENIDRRLGLLEGRLCLLEGCLLRNEPKPVKRGFSQFKRLPTELRHRILDMAIPRRKFRPYHPIDSYDNVTGGSTGGLLPPVISQVCHEARSLTTCHGDWYHIYHYHISGDAHHRCWTWFDGSRDVLELPSHSLPKISTHLSGIMEILRRSETILISLSDAEDKRMYRIFQDPEVRRTLRTINVQSFRPEAAHKLVWNYQAIEKVFGIDTFHMVDLKNPDSISRTRRLLSSNGPEQHRYFDVCLAFLKRQEENEKIGHTFSDGKAALEKAWLKGYIGNGKCISRDGSVEKTKPWVCKCLARMPRVRFVYTLERGDGPHEIGYDDLPRHPMYDIEGEDRYVLEGEITSEESSEELSKEED